MVSITEDKNSITKAEEIGVLERNRLRAIRMRNRALFHCAINILTDKRTFLIIFKSQYVSQVFIIK